MKTGKSKGETPCNVKKEKEDKKMTIVEINEKLNELNVEINMLHDPSEIWDKALEDNRWKWEFDYDSGDNIKAPVYSEEEKEELAKYGKLFYEIVNLKEELSKQKKAIREEEKAKAKGLSLEEYKAEKVLKAKKSRYAREIKELNTEIERLKNEVTYREKWLEKN